MTIARQPSLYLPHGGGPCFFMEDPDGVWQRMGAFLRSIPASLPEAPKAILVVSGHWETAGIVFTASARPELLFDYYGFPPHTYLLRYDAPGAPDLAARAASMMKQAGIPSGLDAARGLDHGVFVPLKMAFPDATVPVVEMSLDKGLDPGLHIAVGRALAPLRDDGVLIIGAGMSFHNMRGYRDARFTAPSMEFDNWLTEAAEAGPDVRAARLKDWASAPAARLSHPREEHLLPLMVAAGASEAPGERIYNELVMKTMLSGFRFL